MADITKFDLYLTQTILKTSNLKTDKREVVVGGLADNIVYVKNNPVNVNIISNDAKITSKMSVNSVPNFDTQYIHRIQKTPFFVSYISHKDYNIKIVDFYDWRQEISIYRLFIFKKINFDSIRDTLKINLQFDSEPELISENKFKINKVLLQISENIDLNKSEVSFDLSTTSSMFCYALSMNFDTKDISSITVDSIVKKFYELENICRKYHISNHFITKNMKAENELDELWNKQKYLSPNLYLDKEILKNNNSFENEKKWINDFFNYFSIESILKFENKEVSDHSSNLLDYVPSKSQILKNYKEFDLDNDCLIKEIQDWWDAYSLPVFANKFADKCLNEPEEVFAVYFLAIKLNLPWASILYVRIYSIIENGSTSYLLRFLALLSFFYKRFIKGTGKSGNKLYSPGYLWDNNYKSINSEFEITKFSNEIYTRISIRSNNSFKINKLCRILLEEKDKKISIFPILNNSKYKIINDIIIEIDGYFVKLPLVWQNGYFEFSKVKVKWILKKKRFQFTIHSNEKKTIKIHNDVLNISPEKKLIHYVEIEKNVPKLYLNMYNNAGGTQFSRYKGQHLPVIVSGFAVSEYGTISNKILYSAGQRKHQLFDLKDIYSNQANIEIGRNINQVHFFSKFASSPINLQRLQNDFIDKLLNLNSIKIGKLIVTINEKFSKDINKILSFFQNNFSFQPEFIFYNEKSQFQLKSNLIIEFEYKKNVSIEEMVNFEEKNKLVLIGDSIILLLDNLKNIIKNNLQNNAK